jgi:Aspartyl protease
MTRYLRTICCAFALIVSIHFPTSSQSYQDIKLLYTQKQYFALRDTLRKYQADQSAYLNFYRGVVSNKFNQPSLSIKYLQQYLKQKSNDKDGLLKDCYEMLADSYVKIHEYRLAAETCRVLLGKFRARLDSDELKETQNDIILLSALSEVPRQSVQVKGDTLLRTSKDKASLINLPVEIGTQQVSWVFDTGANLSSITVSCAKQVGLKIIDSYVEVETSTNAKVKAKLGVAPEIKIGQVTIKNVVFLVFDDKDLFFPQIDYQINGIIGFPVITALGEITFTRNGDLIIPERPHAYDEQNLCFDGLMPLISGVFRDKQLVFKFDSGASSSDLSYHFFKTYEAELKERYPLETRKFAGAGGAMEVKSYGVKDLTLQIAGKRAEFAKIHVLTIPIDDMSHYTHGNLGQDLIGQFERMTLNFESMSILFN